MRDAIDKHTQYNLILVDAYNWTSIPEELVTKEFFSDLKKMSDNIMLNMIMDKNMELAFSQHLLATLSDAWPEWIWYKNVSEEQWRLVNFIVTSKPFTWATRYDQENTSALYTDDKHSVEVDKAAMFHGW